ncbi:hypothetical protein DSO57_1004665 [Entomophthora muscae]|uniref:Uncharacterized protein n=1 Tax=Entomophthora muscae TaxID=34485 RepID=A0ACC2T7W5_9FUNG|nr:hypothetical protein DSO57_1004665 [Entomophthora muscae]
MSIDSVALGIGVLGAVLNLGLGLVTLSRKRGGVDWGLMLAIAALDSLCSLFFGLRVVVKWVDEQSVSNGFWCGVGSLAMAAGLLMALFLASMLSLVRYLVIVRNSEINHGLFYTCVSLVCVFVGGLHIVRGATVDVIVYPSGLLCATQFWGYDFASQFFGISNISIYVLSLLLIVVCYSLLSHRYYSVMRACNYTGCRLYVPVAGLVLVSILYLVAMLPEAIVFFLLHDPLSRRTWVMDAITILPVAAIPTINALHTLALHEDTRKHIINSIRISTETSNPYYCYTVESY